MGLGDSVLCEIKNGPAKYQENNGNFQSNSGWEPEELSAVKLEVKIGLQGCVLSISKRLATPPPAA